MAQTGFTPIQLYSTSTAAAAPVAGNLTNSTLGSELAINITDGKLFYKDNANAVQVIAWKTTPTTAGGTGLTTYTAGDLSYYASGTTFTKLAIGTNGQILTSTGTAPQWSTLSGVAVTTFSAGTTGFTPNSATSGAITLAGTLITSNGGTGLSSYTAGDLSYYASGTTFTKLAIGAANTVLTSSGSAPQWSTGLNNVTIGATTATTGKFTTLEATTSARVGTVGTSVGIFSVAGGRSFFGPNSETYAIGVGFTQARTNSGQVFYMGATDATAPALVFSNSAGTERFRVADNGDVSVVSGNVIIATSGKGIDFSATPGTGTSELLDDYEEGTWTPVITYSGGNGNLSYAVQEGHYTKVGNSVFFIVRLQFGETTAVGYIDNISGLPFTSSTNGGGGMFIDNMTGLTGGGQWQILGSATIIYPSVSGTGGATVIANTSTGAASNIIKISGFYQTTS